MIEPTTNNDIDLGSSSKQFKNLHIDGVANVDSIAMPTTTVTDILDEDNMASDSATALATQQSIKAYVDTQLTAEDLDFQADTGGALSIDLDSETLTFTGGTGIDTSGSGNAVTFAIDSTVATLTGSQTLTNKTIDADNNTLSNIEVDNLKSGVLDTDLSSVAATDTTLASAKAIKAYVDTQLTAEDLDFQADTGGALSIDLDSETLTFTGGTGIDTSGSGNAVTFAIDSTVATLAGTQTFTNKTFDANGTGNSLSNVEVADFAGSAIVTESEGIGSNDNDTTLPTSAAVKDYVDTQITAEDLDVTTDSGTIAIDLDSETLTIAGGTGLDSSATSNTVTLAIDSTVTTLTGTQTLTNKTLTSPTINGGSLSSAVTGSTQTAGTNNTTIATTAFAQTAASNEAVALAIALG